MTTPDQQVRPSPRAVVTATGYVFQSVGVALILSSCCVWSVAAELAPVGDSQRDAANVPSWTDVVSGERLPGTVLMIGIVTTLIGGLGLVAVGVGLQGERPRSGRMAVVVTATMTVLYAGCCTMMFQARGLTAGSVVAGVLFLLSLGLLVLAARSAAVLRHHPPPPDLNVVTEQQLQEMQSRRRHG